MQDTIIVGGISEVDNELFVQLDHYQQEREGRSRQTLGQECWDFYHSLLS
ncbi:hypothetical protein S40285_10791 [Stachybotrys chlorohalonatus IBT 40285]|uniref:Uncharacterized protein n=1 Tax=Stachybotrys chlorohalonatus (strain IBT 40285) TaxID=1283841 RepID=A0A084QZL6_STAC4|nr:hypothetical protein S40285_10791 [Stachybotrys chlorohalonata IBT 40285]